ncbi:M23 family metallopeptidase [Thetidibacter halocola]|uniref:M23 family metallopeptidase n=1 Tax=Thetidibacter halocola TaxID=2827239 RepID=A0A8J7WGD1_9RHOB|nr:M23 family metallopeptidase [Thetidibacter halocola]MBS0124778.1 M23 family metallopeptidase [Thetidibacter halocola]
MRAALLITVLSAAGSLAAEPFLSLPIDCVPGTTCFIEDYVDADPGPGQSDYMCGAKSRDDHRGTDIALPDFAAMEAGVNVLAAASGVVEATRDGMTDRILTPENASSVEGRECGNAVRIGHENGLKTLYCHMAQGSIGVHSGDRVQAGQPIGRVGLSGQTTYPHVHISVLNADGSEVDPFAPGAARCGEAQETLWLDPIPYDRSGLFTAGFSDGVPGFDAVRSGDARRAKIGRDAPLVLYGYAFHAETGDRMLMRVEGPGGALFDHEETIDEGKAQLFRAFGRRAPEGGWPPGAYRGFVTVLRGDRLIAARHADVTVP